MAILVTGGTGFVGLNVCEALLERGETVVALGRGAPPARAAREFARFGSRFTAVDGDVRDAAVLEALFARHGFDRVVHAAVITAGPDWEARAPREVVDVNVGGTVGVLEAARRAGVGRIVYLSSGSTWGATHEREPWLDEDTPCRPNSMYAITKFAAEGTCLRLAEVWGLDVVCARLGSVIGPWERDTGVRDTLSLHFQIGQCALRGEPVVLPARDIRRDNVYSRDVAAGVLALLDARSPAHRLFCLSSGREWFGTMNDWCEVLAQTFPGFGHRIAREGETPTVAYVGASDRAPMRVDRLAADTGFRTRFGPAEAYADYAAWLARGR